MAKKGEMRLINASVIVIIVVVVVVIVVVIVLSSSCCRRGVVVVGLSDGLNDTDDVGMALRITPSLRDALRASPTSYILSGDQLGKKTDR